MADVLQFESGELEILETFEHEEEIQRPEELRFYTLDEQLTDFFEKLLPSTKLTRFQEKELRNLRDRARLSYEKTILVTDTDYVIDLRRKSINVPWVHPVYSDFDYEEYSYAKQWEPLFSKEQRRLPNYYSRLVKALPKPYKTSESGNAAKPGELLDKDGKNPVKVLDTYKVTKTQLNDDGTYAVIDEHIQDTRDILNFKGYYLSERPLEIPRSFEHPFLKSRHSSFVESTSSLLNVFPSVEAILEHAIPTTTDPYKEGKKYLDLYDVQLNQISWDSWKERFPPSEYRDVPIPRTPIDLKKDENEKPAEILLTLYDDWNSAYDPRFWLTLQKDSGTLVSKLLLSNANSTGSLNAYPFTEINYTYPDSQPEICQSLFSSFDTFLESGLYRPFKRKVNGKEEIYGKCIPITTILQEKTALMYGGRIPWKETTKHEIVSEYQQVLKKNSKSVVESIEKYDKYESRKDSERRTDILAIMKDPQREDEDKAEALEKIVRDLELTDKLYFDAAKDYVMCSHTLEVLKGVLKETKTKFKFYEEWTANIEGSRICKFCGEQINNDSLVAVNEYDSEGHLVMEYQALSSEIETIISLNSLKGLFDQDNGGESLMYIILTFLQIIPIEQQLIPILQLIRSITENLKKRSKMGKISQDDSDYAEGLMGIAGLITLLQTHNPFLIPKRKVGPKAFETVGFPRDEGEGILKSIIQVLMFISKTFPVLFKGSISVVVRKILKNTEDFKIDVERFIKKFYEHFKPNFDSAKERYIEPTKDEEKNVWILPMKLFTVSPENNDVVCKIFKTRVSTRMKRVLILHKSLPLETKFPSPSYKLINVVIKNPEFKEISKEEIRRNIELGISGFSEFNTFMKIADGIGYITLSNQILTILRNSSFSLKEQEKFRIKLRTLKLVNLPLLRDIAKGIFLELLSTIKKSQPLVRLVLNAIKTDLTLKMILTNKKDAEDEEFELIAKERNYVKASLRAKSDVEREVYDQLLKLGIADFIVTNKDREKFYKDYENITQLPDEEDGTERDYVENGNLPVALDGTEMQVDYGDYGDRAVLDYNDYTTQEQFADD